LREWAHRGQVRGGHTGDVTTGPEITSAHRRFSRYPLLMGAIRNAAIARRPLRNFGPTIPAGRPLAGLKRLVR
jgi:hypothetical protein